MTDEFFTDLKADILVVDDDLPSLRLLSNLLSDRGYPVRSARSGAEAIMMAEADPPDLILLDIRMPGMDGFQVCEQLKNDPATVTIPVLFISANDEVLDKVRGFELGGVDYILKPFQEEEVLARIRTHLTIARLNAQLRSRLNELSALHQISKTVTMYQDLPQALEMISQTICNLFEAQATLIACQEAGCNHMKGLVGYERRYGAIASATAERLLRGVPFPPGSLTQGKSVVFSNLDSLSLPEVVRDAIRDTHLSAMLVTPLTSHGVGLGVLLIGKGTHNAGFSEFEIKLAETVATDIAAAIENDRLTTQARLAAVDAERQRLARELHDSATQSIYSLTLLSSGWESMARQGTLAEPAEAFHRLGEVGQQALREMRLLLHQLRPSILAEEGLVKALQQRLERVELRANIDAQLTVLGNLDDLPQNIEDELFHIAQEALNNSLRHAQAKQVRVVIEARDGQINLGVEDDGRGFDLQKKHSGMGLGNMQERARSIAGELTIQSEPGNGVKVRLWAPDSRKG